MTIEDLEQLKADGMIDDRKYQQLKAKISMQGYQPGQQVAPSNAYDMTNYGKNLQAQAEPMEQNFNPSFGYDERNAKIAQLEQQIAMVKERIARNERALTGKSYEDANNQIAALEMRKINSSDPTTLWRWQQQRQDTKEANANTKAKAVEQFKNKVNMWNRTKPSNTPEGLEQQISNINAAILEGDNIGADVSELYVKLQDLQKRLPASENTQADVDTIIKTAKTSDEIASVLNTYTDLRPEQRSMLKVRFDELQKQEKATANEREFIAWVEKKTGKKASSLSDRTLKTYRDAWKNMRGR